MVFLLLFQHQHLLESYHTLLVCSFLAVLVGQYMLIELIHLIFIILVLWIIKTLLPFVVHRIRFH